MDASDEALMRAYVRGDRAAFLRLFGRLAPAVHAFFRRSLRSETAIQDLVQTTFLKVHRARDRWRPDLPVRPWVFAIAAHVRQDALRVRRAEASRDGDTAAAEGEAGVPAAADAEHALFRRTRAERVRQALDALPEGQRTVIHLHRFEGMTFSEIAGVLDTTEGAVKLRAFRGYERLRASLSDLLREDA